MGGDGCSKWRILSLKSAVVEHPIPSYSIFPLGDSAITIDLGNYIDDQHNMLALALHDWLQAHPFPGMTDIIMAYSSVTVFYDPAVTAGAGIGGGGVFGGLEALLKRALAGIDGRERAAPEGRVHRLPVCYEGEYAPDLAWAAAELGLTPQAVVELHAAMVYRVYMLGFLPGFPYMGTVDERIRLPRKAQPVNVPAGAVGIAGLQTGIYSLNSPGGWQIIGRTPVELFDQAASPPVLLQAGDMVEFHPISSEEFRALSARPK